MPPLSTHFESVESREDLNAASVIFDKSVKRFEELDDLPGPLPGSMLSQEDEHTARVPISSQVQMATARARDALEAFHDLTVAKVNPSAALRPFAHYALIRQACEGAALGHWLLRPGKKARRVYRSLNLEFTHDHEAREFARTVSGRKRNSASPELDRSLERLNQLKDTVSQLREMELKRIPPWTDILSDISPPVGRTVKGRQPDSPLVIWKIASAFLHGSSTTTRVLSDLQQITAFNERQIASMQITPSWRLLAASYGTCVDMLHVLYGRYRFLATHDYESRAIELNAS